MPAVNTYLIFNGNCEDAFLFYQSVFGGEFTYLGRFKDAPAQEGQSPMSEDAGNKIMHVSLPMGGGTMLMGSDAGGDWGPQMVQGNNFNLSLNAASKEEADGLFHALAEGGEVKMPLADTFWGDYFGMCTDKFGISWMMSYNTNTPA